jgi:Undecaprenyl-phosphate glucose phosphotransferase
MPSRFIALHFLNVYHAAWHRPSFLDFCPISWEHELCAATTASLRTFDHKTEYSTMKPISARSMVDTASDGSSKRKEERRRRLSPAALAVAERKVRPAYSAIVIAGVVRLIDFASISLSGLALYFAYWASVGGDSRRYAFLAIGIAASAVMTFQALDLYQVQHFQARFLQTPRLLLCWCMVVISATGISHIARLDDASLHLWFVTFFCAGIVVLITERLVLRAVLRKWAKGGRLDRRTIIVGADENGERLIKALMGEKQSNLDILGVFDDRSDCRVQEICAGVPKLGKVDDIIEFARRTRVDLVLFALPISAEKRILQMLRKLWVLPVDIRLSAHTNELRFRPRYYSNLGQLPTLPMFERPITDWDTVTKWMLDRVGGALLLLLAAPMMAIIALAIKFDSAGPALFRQKRFGFNNERIDVFKFRSLYHHCADPLASKVVTRNDPRITRVGRLIRKTSLDELPQLFNVVFQGNLSLVGPRPHAVQGKLQSRLFDETVDGYFARHRVKPGITGWAQINGWRGEIDIETKIQKRVEFDLHYIENWSVLFDLYILCRTPLAMLKAENAY